MSIKRKYFEDINGTLFPVTEFNNGMVIMDYPERPLRESKIDVDKMKKLSDEFSRIIKESGIKIIIPNHGM